MLCTRTHTHTQTYLEQGMRWPFVSVRFGVWGVVGCAPSPPPGPPHA